MPRNIVTHTVSIYQMSRTGNTEGRNTNASYTNVDVAITPMPADIQTDNTGQYSYQVFEVFIWDSTVKISNGDKLVAQDGTTYEITGSPNPYNNRYVQATRTLAKVVT